LESLIPFLELTSSFNVLYSSPLNLLLKYLLPLLRANHVEIEVKRLNHCFLVFSLADLFHFLLL